MSAAPQAIAAPAPGRTGATSLLVATMLLWGANLPVIKWLVADFDLTLMSGLRMVAASLPLAWMLSRRSSWPRLTRPQWGWLLLCGVLMVYLNQLLLTAGLSRSNATNGSLITALNPLGVALLAAWLLREALSPRRVVALLCGLAGVAIIVLQRPGAELAHGGLGDLMMVAGVMSFTLGVVFLQRHAAGVDALAISVVLHAVGAVGLLLQAAVEAAVRGRVPHLPANGWAWLVLCLSGAFCTGLANLMWNMSVQRIGVARAASWMYWVPVIGVAIAVAFLGEPFSRWHLVGMVLVLGGSWIGVRARIFR